jgi:hypothetical protein
VFDLISAKSREKMKTVLKKSNPDISAEAAAPSATVIKEEKGEMGEREKGEKNSLSRPMLTSDTLLKSTFAGKG